MPAVFWKGRNGWKEGWRVLRSAAQYDRDSLLPAPSTNCNGCLPSELRYDTAFAMQDRVLYSLWKEGTPVFTESLHVVVDAAPLEFSCRAAPRLSECPENKGLLGWSARGSDTYTREAVWVLTNLQRLVIKAWIGQPNADPLAEEETITLFESSLDREQTSGSRARAVELKSSKITQRKSENTQDVLWSQVIACQRLDDSLPGFHISWGTVTWSRGSIMSGTSSWDVLCHVEDLLRERFSANPRVQWYRDLFLDVAGRDLSQNETWCWQ